MSVARNRGALVAPRLVSEEVVTFPPFVTLLTATITILPRASPSLADLRA